MRPAVEHLGLVVLLATIAWTFRLLSLWRGDLHLGGADFRGLLADAVGALLVAWCAMAVRAGTGKRRIGRKFALIPPLAWATLLVAAHEQVRSLGSPLTLDYVRYLGDPTFLVGSALRPVLLAHLAVTMVVAGAGTWRLLRERPSARALTTQGIVVVVATAVLWATPVRQDAQAWRQTLVRSSSAFVPLGDESARTYREPDLEGSRWIEPPVGQADVLLVVLEGVSGASLPTVASAHGVSLDSARDFAMPRLDALARQAVTVTSFVTEQRQTNRGMYALLCGQSPRLQGGEARLTEIARGLPHPPCLPDRLHEAGYRTVFFEATPLSFMFMDTAMPRLGFQSMFDDAYFEQAGSRNSWGVDDKTFFRGSLELIEQLDEDPEPWFLTLLTAGTHHPYDAVPNDFVSPYPPRTLGRAMAYLDEAVGELLAGLDSRSRDLLLVVTSDESAGRIGGGAGSGGTGSGNSGAGGDLHRELSQNWGVLMVRTPEPVTRRVGGPVLQSDIALSLLDLLDLTDGPRNPGPGGRSLFREPPPERIVAFGNTYQGRISGYDPATGHLLRCSESFEGCQAFRSGSGRGSGSLFAEDWSPPLPVESGPESEPVAALFGEVRRQVRAGAGSAGRTGVGVSEPSRSYVLAAAGERPIQASGHQLVFGGQYLDVPAGSRVTVDLAAEVVGEAGWAHVRHALSSTAGAHFRSELPVLASGDSFELRYTFCTSAPLARLDARMLVDPLDGSGLSLRVDRAQLELELEDEAPEDDQPQCDGSAEVEMLRSSFVRRTTPPTFRHTLEDVATDPSSGLVRRGNVLVWSGPDRGLTSGPRFYAPAGSTIRIRAVLESTAGHYTAGLLLGSQEPSLLLASSSPRSLAPGEVVELRLEHQLTATLNELVTGLRFDAGDFEGGSPGSETPSLVLRMFDVEVSPR